MAVPVGGQVTPNAFLNSFERSGIEIKRQVTILAIQSTKLGH